MAATLMLSMKKMFEESLAALLEKDNEIERLQKEIEELKSPKFISSKTTFYPDDMDIDDCIDELQKLTKSGDRGFIECLEKVRIHFYCQYHYNDFDEVVEAVKNDDDHYVYDDWDKVVEAVKDSDEYYVYKDFDEVVEAVKENSDLYVFERDDEITEWVEENCDFNLTTKNHH